MRKTLIIAALGAFALTGCGEMVDKAALKDAQNQCASKGLQFYKTDERGVNLLVVGEDRVKGVCVGPGDPRYVAGK